MNERASLDNFWGEPPQIWGRVGRPPFLGLEALFTYPPSAPAGAFFEEFLSDDITSRS
jgi:hypothetical protein